MNTSQTYILISIIVLAVIMTILILVRKKMGKPLSKLTAIAFMFVIAGIAFGDNRLTSYILMGFGVALAIIDIIRKSKNSSVKSG